MTRALVLAVPLLSGAALATGQEPVRARPVLEQKVQTQATLQEDLALAREVALARDLPAKISPAGRRTLDGIVAAFASGKQSEATWGQWRQLVSTDLTEIDINQVIQWVLRQSYLESNNDLREYADKVRWFNERKQALRREANALRRTRSTTPAGTSARVAVPEATAKLLPPGVKRIGRGGTAELTATQLDAYLEALEGELASAGEDAQLANLDLQNALQGSQRTLQLISQISKALHETSLALLRKIGE